MMAKRSIERQILDALREGGRILIAAHESPDGDSIGSQLAIYDLCLALGGEPLIVSHDAIDHRYRFLGKYDLISPYEPDKDYGKFDQALILEGTELKRIGNVQRLLSKDCRIINIDHHSGNGNYGDINWVDQDAPAAGVMIYDLFQTAKIELSEDNLAELYLAIMTDTGRFTFSNTDAQAFTVAADLVAGGARPQAIAKAVYSTFSEAQVRMLGVLIANMELFVQGRLCILTCDRKLLERYGIEAAEMEGLVNYSLFTEGVEVGVLLREFQEGVTKVSLRSQSKFDVAALARRFNGGGHPTASGCNIAEPLPAAKKMLIELISKDMAA